MTTTADYIEQVAKNLGITMKARFIPWSQSRNKGEKYPSLNWEITLAKDGRDILTTDYMAGLAHCPAYKAPAHVLSSQGSAIRSQAIKKECETGFSKNGEPIMPKLADVLYSLASDSDVINYGTLEEWAENLGYDADSRKVESIYRACLEIGLKLRNALGEFGLAALREATQDY